jgi:pyruvate,orthophosphate dikinase
VTWVYASDAPPPGSPEERVLLLGGKAANLSVMAVDLGLPVPPGFTITTSACRAYLDSGWPSGLDEELRAAMAGLEVRVGRPFGDRGDPLLVSVRSGAPRSMPGMMDTILNLGLNSASAAGLARVSGSDAFAADCLRRFREQYASVVGSAAPDDPWAQLRGAVEAVFRSWLSERAVAYREVEGIPDDLGTGVTVQAMVFGNRGPGSGTGVLFTRNPATGEGSLYGDVLFDAQGEDVVAGTHTTEPVAGLASRMPAVYDELTRHAATLERHFADCCDIEFTIEQGRLWLLQTRVGKRTPQAALRMAVEMGSDPSFPLTREAAVRRVLPILASPPTEVVAGGSRPEPVAVGLGASPGIASGEIRLTPDGAASAAAAGRDVILVRAETSPDDVVGMRASRGVLTSRGGFASHAAVVARGWGIPAVVGAAAIVIEDSRVRAGPRTLLEGDVVSIDGSTGELFDGIVTGAERIVPEAAVLLGWARELGIDVEGGATTAPSDASGGVSRDDALRALLIKGYGEGSTLAPALDCSVDDATRVITELVDEDLAEPGAGAFRLTPSGREAAMSLLAGDREAWGPDAADVALDAFLALDARMKAIVTDWQMRGPQTVNDHADAAYDAGVLERLAELHADVEAWLTPLVAGLPRLAGYGARLEAAVEAARSGNGKFVASPRVDSYHSAWFELHEDLIRLAGRTRESEAAAGRA